jgi:hypothetical protein
MSSLFFIGLSGLKRTTRIFLSLTLVVLIHTFRDGQGHVCTVCDRDFRPTRKTMRELDEAEQQVKWQRRRDSCWEHFQQHYVLRLCGCQRLYASNDFIGEHLNRCSGCPDYTGIKGSHHPFTIVDAEHYKLASNEASTRYGERSVVPRAYIFPHW